MGYYKLSGRDLLELEIPSDKGILGVIDDNVVIKYIIKRRMDYESL